MAPLQELLNLARNNTKEFSFLAKHNAYRGNFPR